MRTQFFLKLLSCFFLTSKPFSVSCPSMPRNQSGVRRVMLPPITSCLFVSCHCPQCPSVVKPLLMQCDITTIGAGLVCIPVFYLSFSFLTHSCVRSAGKQEDPEEEQVRAGRHHPQGNQDLHADARHLHRSRHCRHRDEQVKGFQNCRIPEADCPCKRVQTGRHHHRPCVPCSMQALLLPAHDGRAGAFGMCL